MFLLVVKVFFSLVFLIGSSIIIYLTITSRGFAEDISFLKKLLLVLGLLIILFSSIAVLVTTLFM